ncbi:MAG: hypothetical protein NT092_00455 [Bacteroidia bacterium]|nr:hypothetical protein [Bacteroidia bacterium]
MTFDNSRTIISFRIKLFFATVLLIAWLIVVYLAEKIKFPLLGMSDTAWTLILVAIYLVINLIPMVRNFQFVSFSDEGDDIVFKYFFAGIVGGKKNTISISKRTFAGYNYEKKYLGLVKSIILLQRMGQGIAKYPPVYISALTREQKAKLLSWLNQYSSKA